MTPVVLLRSNDVCFLGIARSLAAAGTPVIPIHFTWDGAGPWYSEKSRHIRNPHVIPNPYEEPEAAADAFEAIARQLYEEYGQRLLCLGSSDVNLMFLLDNESRLAPYLRFMGHADMNQGRGDVIRKDSCATLLAQGDVSIPKTLACKSHDDIEHVVENMIYPCVYKPATKDYGQSFYAKYNGDKAIDADSPDVLRTKLAGEMDDGYELVVQERVFFDSVYDEIPVYVYADANHQVRVAATAIKETIQPFPYGTATVLRLTWHPELLATAQAVVRALKWRGILMIELIRDQKDDVWKVIEINGRPWLFVDFFRRFGLNYLKYLVEDDAGRTDEWPDLLTLPDAPRAERPMHVDLPTAVAPHLEGLDHEPTVEDVATFMRGIRGQRSLTFLDPNDPEPGRAQMADLARKWSFDEKSLLESVRATLSEEP